MPFNTAMPRICFYLFRFEQINADDEEEDEAEVDERKKNWDRTTIIKRRDLFRHQAKKTL